jgi:hypothetical protein
MAVPVAAGIQSVGGGSSGRTLMLSEVRDETVVSIPFCILVKPGTTEACRASLVQREAIHYFGGGRAA